LLPGKREAAKPVTTIEITQTELIVTVQGLDKLLALKHNLRIPLAHIIGVERAYDAVREYPGARMGGLSVPGLTAGTYAAGDGLAFWLVDGRNEAIAIYLRDDRYCKLIIDVEDPNDAIGRIIRALKSYEPASSASRMSKPR
jgi:hypothetical protein